MIADPFRPNFNWTFCGRCGHKLNLKNKKDALTGFCSKCRRPPPAGQLELPLSTKAGKPRKK